MHRLLQNRNGGVEGKILLRQGKINFQKHKNYKKFLDGSKFFLNDQKKTKIIREDWSMKWVQ